MPRTRRSFLLHTSLLAGAALVGCRAPRSGAPPGGDRTFLDAVRRGDVPVVRRLLAADPGRVDARDAEGRSALVVAHLHHHDAVVAALLEHDPEVGLIEAVMLPDWDRAEVLHRAAPDELDTWHPVGGTALYAAARLGRTGFWRLQSWGADANATPPGPDGVPGRTPAWGALECGPWVDAMRAAVALLSNGGDVNAPQRGGETLLHLAARRGDPYLLRYLVRLGADVDARDAGGATALDQAVRAGKDEAAALLRDHGSIARNDFTTRYAYDASGAPVLWPDLSDVSPEEQGAVTGPSHGNLAAVRAAVGDEPRRSFSRSTQDELAVEACSHTGAHEIIRFHLDHGVPQSLVTSISLGDLDRARALLDRHPNAIHERGPHDFAPMWYPAIAGGDVEAAELLLAHGAGVDQESQGTTGLHWAASRGHLDLVHYLAEQGADLDAVGYKFGREGHTPLQHARERGHDDVVRALKELGARDGA